MQNLLKQKDRLVWFFFILVMVVIIIWRGSDQYHRPKIKILSLAPSPSQMQFITASDSSFSYRLLMFWLQQFDVQSGQYVSYRNLDYEKVIQWLDMINYIEPSSQYSMLLASRVYSRVADNERKKLMLDYVYREFEKDPNKNWRWLAEATITAQHRLKDLQLALKYARALAENESKEIPRWAKDIRLIILEDLGELEQVKLLVGGLIVNKTVTDPNEIRFFEVLMGRIEEKEKKYVK